MTEHITPPPEDREIDRIELDIEPFVDMRIRRSTVERQLSTFTKRLNVELGKRGIYVALFHGHESVEEPGNAQAIRRVFDEEHINNAVLEATRNRSVISDTAARVIAAQLHGGQDTALYDFASTGAIVDNLLEEIDIETRNGKLDPLARNWAEKLDNYVMVRIQSGEWGPVEGWRTLWLGIES